VQPLERPGCLHIQGRKQEAIFFIVKTVRIFLSDKSSIRELNVYLDLDPKKYSRSTQTETTFSRQNYANYRSCMRIGLLPDRFSLFAFTKMLTCIPKPTC
jgi:hypothetical protein